MRIRGARRAANLVIRAVNRAGRPFGINPVPRAFPIGTSPDAGRAAVFDEIYRRNAWGSAESRSGPGSELGLAGEYRERLRALLAEFQIRTLFDAPCGDLNWILPLAQDPAVNYLGGDISAALLADVRARVPGLDLRQFDICADPFPAADAWHCRDCLFHLPFADIRKALANFAGSSIPYALLTSHRARILHRNLDVEVGGFRYLDLERPPISLPPPLRYIRDYRFGPDFPRGVGLWTREQIAQAL